MRGRLRSKSFCFFPFRGEGVAGCLRLLMLLYRFAEEKKKYERLRRKEKNSFWDDIAFMKLQSAEDIRLKKLEQSRLRRSEEANG